MTFSVESLEVIKSLMQQVVLSPVEEDFVNKARKVILAWEEVNRAIKATDERTAHDNKEV